MNLEGWGMSKTRRAKRANKNKKNTKYINETITNNVPECNATPFATSATVRDALIQHKGCIQQCMNGALENTFLYMVYYNLWKHALNEQCVNNIALHSDFNAQQYTTSADIALRAEQFDPPTSTDTINSVESYFTVTETQFRGTLHAHTLLWTTQPPFQ